MHTAVRAIHHDHCYVSPLKQGATSLLFPSVSGLNTSIQGGKVVVVTSQGLMTTQSQEGEKHDDGSEEVSHDHGYSQSSSEDERTEPVKRKKSISLDLPTANSSGSDPGFTTTTSGMTFPDCQYSLPAIIFAQDEEEPAEGQTGASKLDLPATESHIKPAKADLSQPPAEKATPTTPRTKQQREVKVDGRKRQKKETVPPKPTPEPVIPERKSSRARKPSKKVQEMQELQAEADKKNRKRKFSISIAKAMPDDEEDDEDEFDEDEAGPPPLEAEPAVAPAAEPVPMETETKSAEEPAPQLEQENEEAEEEPEEEKPSPKKKKEEKEPPKEKIEVKEDEAEERPEQNEEEGEEEEKEEEAAVETPVVKRGRGRPRKHPPPTQESEGEEPAKKAKPAKDDTSSKEETPTRASRSQSASSKTADKEEEAESRTTRRTRASLSESFTEIKPRGRPPKTDTSPREKQAKKEEPAASPPPTRRSGRGKVEEETKGNLSAKKTDIRQSPRGQKAEEETKTPLRERRGEESKPALRGRRVQEEIKATTRARKPDNEPKPISRGRKADEPTPNKTPEVESKLRGRKTEEPKSNLRGRKTEEEAKPSLRGRRSEEPKVNLRGKKTEDDSKDAASKKSDVEPRLNLRGRKSDVAPKPTTETDSKPALRGRRSEASKPAQQKEKEEPKKAATDTPTRGRGRPPKIRSPEVQKPEIKKRKSETKDEDEPSEKKQEVEPKRGRGRPRKEVPVSTDDDVPSAKMPELEPKRGRGRAKKVVTESTDNSSSTPTKRKDIKSNQTEKPSPKKKILGKKEEETEEKDVKKRGRKKKVIEECTTTEDEEEEEKSDISIRFIPDPLAMKTNQWGQAVPLMVLLRIFQQVIKTEGQMPFLSRASRVCRMWYEVSHHPSLWSSVDLSGSCVRKYKKSLQWLCRNRLGDCTNLNLTGWSTLTDQDMQMMTRHCRNLEGLNLSECNKLTSEAVRTLADSCQQLEDIDLSQLPSSGKHEPKSCQSLCHLAERFGSRLRRLSLGNNTLEQPDALLEALMTHCPSLEHLDLSNCLFSTSLMKIPLERLQESCPDLRSLLLGNSLFQVKEPHSKDQASGFVKLESLDVSRCPDRFNKFRYVTDDILRRILGNAFDMRELDVSGCVHITTEGLKGLPIVSLKSLGLGHSKAVLQPEFIDVILKWAHSLQKLDLTGNSVSEEMILKIIDGCPNLELLDLSACRGLPYTCRHEFSSIEDIAGLRETLKSQQSSAPTSSTSSS